MSQAPKTDLARELWETCPKCYGDLLADRDGGLYCPQGHYRAANATSLPSDVDPGQKLIADGGGGDCSVDGCDGAYKLDSIVDKGGTGHRRVVSTCEHTLIVCEYCRRARPADEIVFSLRPDVAPPAGKSVLCKKCAKGNRVYSLTGWDT